MDTILTIIIIRIGTYLQCYVPFIMILLILSSSCDAPRNNPLDPKNPDNTYYIIQGKIKTLSLPAHPLENVTIFYVQQALQTTSNTAGDFSLETTKAQDGWLRFHKSGYITDSTFIVWGQSRRIEIEKYLNSEPQLDSLQIYSVILNRYPMLQTEQIVVQAKLSDRDNDIDSVKVNIDVVSKEQLLQYNVIDKRYEHTFSVFDLGVTKIEALLGYSFKIMVIDIFKHRFNIGAGIVERIIRDEPLFYSPSGNEITSPTPTLTWERFNPGFDFSYSLQIYSAEITPQLVWEKHKLSDDQSSYTVDLMLPPDEYFWVVWVIDEFGNRARSKPASFKVE